MHTRAKRRGGPGRLALTLLVGPFLWAIPFALFFGTLYGRGWSGYGRAYVISLVFAAVIRLATVLVEHVLVPRFVPRRPDGSHGWLPESALYFVATVGGSFVAAFLVDWLLLPGFM